MMSRSFRCLLILCAVSLVFIALPTSFAQEIDKNTSPVTGRLPDPMRLEFQGRSSFDTYHPTNKGELSIWFCTRRDNSCVTPDRKLRMRGKRQTSSVKLTPEIEGEWRWSSDYHLSFKPKKAWQAGTRYHLEIDPHLYSPEITIERPQAEFTTGDLTAEFQSMQYFQDPTDIEKKGVTAELSLSFPVEEKSFRENLEITLEELTDGPPEKRVVVAAKENLPFEVRVSPSKLHATLSVSLKVLPEKERFLRARVKPGVRPFFGGSPLGKEFDERVLIPSVTSYARVSSLQPRIMKNMQFEPEQIIAIETNVPLPLEELKRQLSLRLLPKDKPPGSPSELAKKDYAWSSSAEVTEAILKTATPVEFTLNPVEGDKSTLYSAKFKADPGRWIYARVGKGTKFRGGYILGENYNTSFQAPFFGTEARLLSEGAVLSLSGEKKVSVYALGVDKLEFEVGKVLTSEVNHLVSQTSGSFSHPSFQNWSFNDDNLVRRETQEQALQPLPPNKPQFTVFDFSKYLGGQEDSRGLFFLNVIGKKKSPKGEEDRVTEDKRFILITDIGFSVKTARDGTSDLFAQSLKTGEPTANAKVEVLGTNGVPVFSGVTDADGHLNIPNLSTLQREKAPVAFLLRSGDDLSFMPYQRSDRQLNYSRYEVSGAEAVEDGMRAFLFSDRGIYRPGDQINVGMIVKQGDWAASLDGVPLFVTIDNPRGQQIEKKLVKLSPQGFLDYSFRTKEASPTGVYAVNLSLSQDNAPSTQLASTNVRVEEFLPDTMKITSAFSKGTPKGWLTPDKLQAEVTLMHLYGAAAAEHRIHANFNVNPGSFSFGGEFADFAFFDPKQTERSFDQDLGDLTTDELGKATFPLNLAPFGDSTFRLTFYAEGFAPASGRSVRTARTALVSSLSYVVGSKPEGNLHYINKNTERAVRFVAVDPELSQIAVEGLTAEVSKINYTSTLVRNEYGAYAYRSMPQETKVDSKPVSISESGFRYVLDSRTPGDYILTLLDRNGLKRSRVSYTVVGAANLLGHERKEATISVKLSKAKFEPEESVELSIVSPYTGAGLITIETDRVLAHQWFKTETESSIQHIKLPAQLIGKGYVNVQFVRNIASPQVFTTPLAYTVVPIFVSTDSKDSKIQLTVPEVVQPGDAISMKYRTREPGRIVLFAVDEGILQYGRYQTPDPLSDLLNDRALQVQTHQIFDLLLPEFSLLQKSAAGGDGTLADGKNLNPFKRKTLPPVAFWSGLVDTNGEEHEVFYTVPDYFNGTIRVMAVAVTGASIGAAEQRVPVRGDIIVTPTAPTFVAPGDEFEVGVQVANNIPRSGAGAQIDFSIEPSEQLEIVSAPEGKLTIDEGKETSAVVRLRAKDQPGAASILFRAHSGKSDAKYEATLSVRPAVPSMTVLESGYVAQGETRVDQSRSIYREFSELSATASTMPVSLIPGLQEYLENFPYGCTEQLVSRIMPSVVLFGEKELQLKEAKVAENVADILMQIRERQHPDGSLGFWSRGGARSEFISIYTLHMLLLAREKHLAVPNEMIESLSNYTRSAVNRSVSTLAEARLHAYGIYVLTRGGMVTSNYIPYVLQYLNNNHKDSWKQDLAAVYLAATYRLLQLTSEANTLMKEFSLGDPVYWKAHSRYEVDKDDAFYNSLIRYSMYLGIVSEHFPEMLKELDRNVLFRVANFVGEGSYNTTSSSYAILGLTNYAKASSKQVQSTIAIAQREGDGPFQPVETMGSLLRRAVLAPTTKQVEFSGGGKLGLFYQVSTSGFDRILPTKIVEQGLEVSRIYRDADGDPVREAKLGEEIQVTVRMRAHGDEQLENMVLVDLLPGGFEVVPDSVKASPAAEEDSEEGYDSGDAEEGDGSSEGTSTEPAESDSPQEEAGVLWTPVATDVREDRVLAFGTIPTEEVIFRYKIKAVNAGAFATPPAYAESMYDRTKKARGIPDRLIIVP